LPTDNDFPIAINAVNLKNVLRDIQSNYLDLFHGFPPVSTVA
jgi:hypothetical protein